MRIFPLKKSGFACLSPFHIQCILKSCCVI